MAPATKSLKPSSNIKNTKESWISNILSHLNYSSLRGLLFDPTKQLPILCVLIILEIFINTFVIQRVKYTEIDWKAYMQEVEGALNGTWDYTHLKGDTGPLVYPAGFVWIFSVFYSVTSRGENILLAQYIFMLIYIINAALVSRIYLLAKKLPAYVLVLTTLTSYRIHSIYLLRLFNDPVAMLFLYAAINAFLDDRWTLGSVLFSIAVSVKMNILLFAPGLLLGYLSCLGWKETLKQLSVCALIQLVLALPFLFTDPIAYLRGSFDLGRVFLYQWTVNWRLIPEEIFVGRPFHIALFSLHLILLLLFYPYSKMSFQSYAKLKKIESDIKDQLKKGTDFNMNTSSQLFLTPLFLANLIGITCSRSLHYQFYVWYFHSLPYLAWSTHYSVRLRLCILGIIELCWNIYPSTAISSLALHVCHATLLWGIYKSQTQVLKHVKGK